MRARFRCFMLGRLECRQDSSTNPVRIVYLIEPGSEFLPLIVSKVVVMDPGGEDQIVIVHAAICRLNESPLGIDTDDFIHEHFHVLLPAEYRSDWSWISSAESKPVAT